MFQAKKKPIIPPVEALPPVRRRDFPEEILPFLIKPGVQTAAAKMVGVASLMKQIPISQVRLSDVLTHEVEAAITEYSHNRKDLIQFARKFCRLAGNRVMFRDPYRPYEAYHPLLSECASQLQVEAPQRWAFRTSVMSFLTWLSQNVMLGYLPHTVPLIRIQQVHLARYRQHLMTRVKKGEICRVTAKAYMGVVIRWIRWLIAEGHIGFMDLQRMVIKTSPNRERDVPTNLIISKFIHNLMEQPVDERYVPLFLLFVATGARPIELRRLAYKDIDFEENAIFLQGKLHPGRLLPLSPNVWEVLLHFLRVRKPVWQSEDRLFAGRKSPDGVFDRKYMDAVFRRVQLEAGVHVDGFMAFRHRLATDCMEAKVPTSVFQYIFGHNGVSELNRYQHANQRFQHQEIQRAFKRLPQLGEFD